jgi:S1-C subfamily serine protease
MMDPKLSIVPVLAIDEAGNVKHFLGTGSFVDRDHLLLTADHVIRDWAGQIAIVVEPNLTTLFRANVVYRDQSHDLALLVVPAYKAPKPIPVAADSPYHPNQFVLAFEYGTTKVAGREIHFAPATRIGNITRQLDVRDMLGLAGDGALELSFPALRGASGAPVISNDGRFALYGVIVANVSYHLLPAQIESVIDERSGTREEVRYMLPQALAVNSRHVAAAIAAAQALPGNLLAG